MANKICVLELKAFNSTLLDSTKTIIQKILIKVPFYISSYVRLPLRIKRFTVLRSPHVNKKSREQFEICTYKHLISLSPNTLNSDSFVVSSVINTIINSMPYGVSIKIKYFDKN